MSGDEKSHPASATVLALLELERCISERHFTLTVGVSFGTVVQTPMGSRHRIHARDVMAMAVNLAARIEQNVHFHGIFVDKAILGQLRSLGLEPEGTDIELHGIKGFPEGIQQKRSTSFHLCMKNRTCFLSKHTMILKVN